MVVLHFRFLGVTAVALTATVTQIVRAVFIFRVWKFSGGNKFLTVLAVARLHVVFTSASSPKHYSLPLYILGHCSLLDSLLVTMDKEIVLWANTFGAQGVDDIFRQLLLSHEFLWHCFTSRGANRFYSTHRGNRLM
ncbi:hypothetical protein NLI96_g613 [Meripilus lineatus]|uniref:Uncharacterized protein n=1 Tax=Meripilus lineatus TaxID=2056292 RepID=A0AAD5YID1_9APHY|nr:hypothetical protein NLI96_g613 [Physisporinus lineatus]